MTGDVRSPVPGRDAGMIPCKSRTTCCWRCATSSKTFGGVHALRDVSFACRRGTVHALLGENGAGKSTLIKILSGAYQADGGDDRLCKGEQLYAPDHARGRWTLGIRIIYQELNLLPDMTVAENIFLGDEPRTGVGLVDTGAMRAAGARDCCSSWASRSRRTRRWAS